jgi:hypothetical protein
MKLLCLAAVFFAFITVSCGGKEEALPESLETLQPVDTTPPADKAEPSNTTTLASKTAFTDTTDDGSDAGASSPDEVMQKTLDAVLKTDAGAMWFLLDPHVRDMVDRSKYTECMDQASGDGGTDYTLEWETKSIDTEDGATFINGRINVDSTAGGPGYTEIAVEVVERNGMRYAVSMAPTASARPKRAPVDQPSRVDYLEDPTLLSREPIVRSFMLRNMTMLVLNGLLMSDAT